MLQTDSMYRVAVRKDKTTSSWYEIACIGMGCVDSPLKDKYDSFEDLPDWVQQKIVILSACGVGDAIDTIGRRMNDSVFLLTGEDDDTGRN